MTVCRCGCDSDTHLHYRAGTDCGHCGAETCPAYVPSNFTPAQTEVWPALAPYALPSETIAEDPGAATR